MIKAVLFDLDGTLLPLNDEEFTKVYFKLLCEKFCPLGLNKEDFINGIWQGTYAMIKNDGKVKNEVCFWECFKKYFGEDKLALRPLFDEFYNNEYLQTKSCVKENPYARQIMDFLHNNKIDVVLASRPIFPKIAMINRAKFVDLKQEDFTLVTSYEFSTYSKPNFKYYEEILNYLNLSPSEVLMFGNNELEDGVAQSIGIKTYLVDNGYLIMDKKPKNLPIIRLNDIIDIVKSHLK